MFDMGAHPVIVRSNNAASVKSYKKAFSASVGIAVLLDFGSRGSGWEPYAIVLVLCEIEQYTLFSQCMCLFAHVYKWVNQRKGFMQHD